VVILSAKLEVHQNDGDLEAGEHEKDCAEEQVQPRGVVVDMQPNSGKDVIQFDPNYTERHDAAG
jgi:hypothetical protein